MLTRVRLQKIEDEKQELSAATMADSLNEELPAEPCLSSPVTSNSIPKANPGRNGPSVQLKELRIILPTVTGESLLRIYQQEKESSSSSRVCLPFRCAICFKRFANRRYFNRHLKAVHKPTKYFTCTSCNRNFDEERYLQKHMIAVHEKKNVAKNHRSAAFRCVVCSLKFKDAKSLNRHFCNPGPETASADSYMPTFVTVKQVRSEAKAKGVYIKGLLKHICSVCDKPFSSKAVLKDHMRVHDKLKPFACQYCTKLFPTKQTLHIHERRHTGERPFGCPLCSKRFVEQGEVKKHVRYHTQEKPFKCTFADCGKGFARKGRLTEHIRTHTGENFHTCRVCYKSYPSLANCSRHEKEVHLFMEPREPKINVKRVPFTTKPRPRTEEELAADKRDEERDRICRKRRAPRTPKSIATPPPQASKTRFQPKRTPAPPKPKPTPEPLKKRSSKKQSSEPVSPVTNPFILKVEIMDDGPSTEIQIKTEFIVPDFVETMDVRTNLFCPYCYKSFRTTLELETHALQTHAEYIEVMPSFNCPHLYCSEKLGSLDELKEHQRTQHHLKDI